MSTSIETTKEASSSGTVLTLCLSDGRKIHSTSPEIVALGKTGVVFRDGRHVLKIARVEDVTGLSENERYITEVMNEINRESLREEADAYRRLGPHHGLAEIVELSEASLKMEYIHGWTLEHLILSSLEQPDETIKRRLLISILDTVCFIHTRRVVVDDIATRNIMVLEDFSTKIIDFGFAKLLGEETDMEGNEEAQADIRRLGLVIYSIATWCIHDCDDSTHLTATYFRTLLGSLHELDYCLFGGVIRKCLTDNYPTVEDLRDDIRSQCATQERGKKNGAEQVIPIFG